MYLRCDGPFGDRSIVSKDAIESLDVYEMGSPVGAGPISGSTETTTANVWDVVIITFINQHKYGSYLTEEEAHEVKEQLARVIEGVEQDHHQHEPEVTIEGVQERIGAWLTRSSAIADDATHQSSSGEEPAGPTTLA